MIFCLEDFKLEIERLCHKNSYKELQKEIISYFFDKKMADMLSGTRLNNDNNRPYIKKRLCGSGGYRIYFLADTIKGNVYLMFVHPKFGSEGYENIKDAHRVTLNKNLQYAIESNYLYELTHTADRETIVFTKQTTLKI